ncbi:adenylate/guanylate cyclase domain-containing protein [Motiliproteus sp. SC1-56]|uniref:adenylate/guanylate cyclase domain-containing protein n=1 Tax=Motiliproteus sp. SC1-56 TaxID=2799565 RepID=UPI001A90A285|nr:adenylate/guanylate cyclase domain-containing protein [Motiliproteus sp. SC1-56]
MTSRKIAFSRLLMAGFGLTLLLGLGISLYLGVSGAEKNTRSLLSRLVQNTMDTLVGELRGQLEPVEGQLRYLADYLAEQPHIQHDTKALKYLLAGALAPTPQVLGIGFFDLDRRMTYVERGGEVGFAALWQERPGRRLDPYLKSLPTGLIWLQPTWSARLGHQVVPVLMPVGGEARPAGLLVAAITIEALSAFLQQLATREGLELFLLYGRDAVLSQTGPVDDGARTASFGDALPQLTEVGNPALSHLWSAQSRPVDWLSLQDVKGHRLRIEGITHFYFYRELAGYADVPWLLGGYLKQVAMPDEIRRLLMMAGAGLVLILAGLGGVAWLSRRIGASVTRIQAGFEAIGNGKLAQARPLAASRIRELDRLARAFNQMLKGLRENERVRRLLGQYVPAQVARELMQHEGTLAAKQTRATILFCDLEGFTALSEQLEPAAIVTLLNGYFSAAVAAIEAEGGLVTQFQGDAILAIFNVPQPLPDHAQRALAAALAIQRLTDERLFEGHRLRCRVGINTGEVVAGSVGAEDRLSYTVHGDAVNLAARLEALNKEWRTRILLSEASAQAIGGSVLRVVGEVAVRGRRQRERLYTPVALQPG